MPKTDGKLDDKVAFVTGAASGIGRATALAFAREGANVVVADIDQGGNQDTVGAIEDLGGQALAVVCDVTHSEDVQTSLNNTGERFGRLDYAFNNAGAEQRPKLTIDITEEEWDRIITINLRSVFLCLKYETPLRLQHGGGAIVNTSSGAGIRVFGRGAAYAAAKHGVVGLTKDAALDYASSNIRINAICPGIIDTEMMDRFTGGTPEERDRVIAQEPIGRMGRQTRSPRPSFGCAPTQPPSSPDTPWSSTAAKRSSDIGLVHAFSGCSSQCVPVLTWTP